MNILMSNMVGYAPKASLIPPYANPRYLLDNPKFIGSSVADENGVASITKNVPIAAQGHWILMQAVVPGECAISQLVVHRFE